MFGISFNNSRKNLPQTPAGPVARLLVIDADASVGHLIRGAFQGEGYQVERCATGDDTYNLDLTDYAVVLIDLEVDSGAGLEHIEQIKQIYDPSEVAVIAYSVRMSPETIIKALNAGADDYLIKPFSMRELKARVHSVMRRH